MKKAYTVTSLDESSNLSDSTKGSRFKTLKAASSFKRISENYPKLFLRFRTGAIDFLPLFFQKTQTFFHIGLDLFLKVIIFFWMI